MILLMKKMRTVVMNLQIFGKMEGSCCIGLLSILFMLILISRHNLLLKMLIFVQHPKNISSVSLMTETPRFCIGTHTAISFLHKNHKVYGKCLSIYTSDEGKYYKKSKHSKVGFKHKEKKQTTQLNKFRLFTPFEKEQILNFGFFDHGFRDPPCPRTDYAETSSDLTKYSGNTQNITSEQCLYTPSIPKSERYKGLMGPSNKPNLLDDCSSKKVNRSADRLYIDKSLIYDISSDQYIVVGFITSVHGLNGYVRVKSYTNNPEVELCKPGYRFLKFPYNDDNVVPMKITCGKCLGDNNSYLIKLDGVDTKTQALRLKGAYITIPLNNVDPLEENTFYSRDLLNLDLYLYNDAYKTKLGKIVGFVHRSDLAFSKKYEDIIDDLIDVEMDMRISLKTLINSVKENSTKTNDTGIREKGLSIVTDNDISDADEVIDISNELDYNDVQGVHYVKYYTCSICKRTFTNYDRAITHDKTHQQTPSIQDNDEGDVDQENKIKLVDIEEISKGKIRRPIRRFYVPLLRDETVKFIDLENKSVYIDPYTIFIGEDGTFFTKNEN